MQYRRLLGFVVAYLVSTSSYARPDLPDIPANSLPVIHALPSSGPLILDFRLAPVSGYFPPVNAQAGAGQAQVPQFGVFDLSNHTESTWDVLQGLQDVPVSCNSCTVRASWAPSSRKLLVALTDSAYLFDEQGRYEKLSLKLPGVSLLYSDLDQFALSADAAQIMIRVTARDRGDRRPDPTDPGAARVGRFYDDLIDENTPGSEPKLFAKGGILLAASGEIAGEISNQAPSWSPDGKLVTYARSRIAGGIVTSLRLIVAEATSSKVVWELPILAKAHFGPGVVTETRWSPDGKKLGFVIRENIYYSDGKHPWRDTLYLVKSDGSNVQPMRVHGRALSISAFAWSPAGDALVFRSDFETKPLCNFNPFFRFEVGHEPCRLSELVYTSGLDGSGLVRISKSPEYLQGQLFWIR